MMQYEKKIRILAGTLVALLLIWGLGEFFAPERRQARSEAGKLLPGGIESVASLEIGGNGGRLQFEKSGKEWSLVESSGRLPAEAPRIESFLKDIASVERLKPVAGSKDAWKGLGLEEDKVHRVLAKDAAGKTLADFSAGGYGPTGGELYLRLGESSSSYSVPSSFASYLSAGRSSWLDRRLFPSPPDLNDVQSVSIEADLAFDGPDKPNRRLSYELSRDAEGWKSGEKILDTVAVESMLRASINLEAEDLNASPPPESFTRESARIVLRLGSGATKRIVVGAPAADGRFWVRVSEAASGGNPGPLGYEISTYSLKSMLRALPELEPKKQ